MRQYCVYILTDTTNSVLYIGVTGDLEHRVWEHKQGKIKGFTQIPLCHFERSREIPFFESSKGSLRFGRDDNKKIEFVKNPLIILPSA